MDTDGGREARRELTRICAKGNEFFPADSETTADGKEEVATKGHKEHKGEKEKGQPRMDTNKHEWVEGREGPRKGVPPQVEIRSMWRGLGDVAAGLEAVAFQDFQFVLEGGENKFGGFGEGRFAIRTGAGIEAVNGIAFGAVEAFLDMSFAADLDQKENQGGRYQDDDAAKNDEVGDNR
jgi:hypothetical protein